MINLIHKVRRDIEKNWEERYPTERESRGQGYARPGFWVAFLIMMGLLYLMLFLALAL